jgi:hypothetical protein
MPVNDGDVAFGFNPQPFLNGIRQVNQGMDRMTSVAKKTADGIGKSMFWALAKVELLKTAFRAAFRTIKSMGQYIPELGKSFGIMREIIFKNLLWPLRQELAPMLQNMLDWVRDNRALFLRFGEALAGAFRGAVMMARYLWTVLNNLVQVIRPYLERVFGDMTGGIAEMVDLVLAKIAVIATFVGRLLAPVVATITDIVEYLLPRLADGLWSAVQAFIRGMGDIGEPLRNIGTQIATFVTNLLEANEAGNSVRTVFARISEIAGQIVGFVADMASSFLTGFVPAISQAMTPLQEIFNSIGEAIERWFTGEEAQAKWARAFEIMGDVVGTTIMVALEMVATAIDGIIAAIDFAMSAAAALGDRMRAAREARGREEGDGLFGGRGPGELLSDYTQWLARGSLAGGLFRSIMGSAGARDENDFIITKRGEVVSTHPDDTIIGTKNPERLGRVATEVTQNVNVQLTVTEGSARRAGEEFAAGMTRGMRLGILDSMVAEGY